MYYEGSVLVKRQKKKKTSAACIPEYRCEKHKFPLNTGSGWGKKIIISIKKF